MERNVPNSRSVTAALERTLRAHEESAARHEAAAALWDTRIEPERADFERRFARFEHELAQLESDRISLRRLRTRSKGRPGPSVAEKINRVEEEIGRRSALLNADDAALERERARLWPASQASSQRADAVDPGRPADRPDRKADPGTRSATVRDEHTPAPELADLEREADRAARDTLEMAQRLASTITRTAEALEQSAALAEEHAERQLRAGRPEQAAEERRVAERTRAAARSARQHATKWLETGKRPRPPQPPIPILPGS